MEVQTEAQRDRNREIKRYGQRNRDRGPEAERLS
jgi:hypothetical protein